MVTQATLRAKIKERSPEQTATYFGLIVEVIDALPILTLVRYRSREFVVYTEDLATGTERLRIMDIIEASGTSVAFPS